MFQDEGNRIGCYALWDSFTDLVNDTDLKFIESLAEEMMNMTAESKSLDWTKNWDKERVRKHILDKLKEIMNDELDDNVDVVSENPENKEAQE